MSIDLRDKTGAAIMSKLKIKLSLVPEPGETFMKGVDADISRLDGAVGSISILALGKALQLTKSIMDIVANVCYYCWDIRVTDAFGRYLIIVDLLHNQVQCSSHAGCADTSQLYQQVET